MTSTGGSRHGGDTGLDGWQPRGWTLVDLAACDFGWNSAASGLGSVTSMSNSLGWWRLQVKLSSGMDELMKCIDEK
jgi:hypothetical protein